MGLATSGAARAFELSQWRDSVQLRRSIIRDMILRVVHDGVSLDTVLDEFRRAVGWYRLSDRDRNGFHVMFRDIKSIVWNWALIPADDQKAFIDGKIVPSTMAKQARALAAPS